MKNRILKLSRTYFLVNSYYPKEVSWAKDFIDVSPEAQVLYFAYQYQDEFLQWLIENHFDELKRVLKGTPGEIPDDANPDDPDFWDFNYLIRDYFDPADVGRSFLEDFFKHMPDHNSILDNDPANAPSYQHMSYEGVIKNQWLIHFTNDALGIARNGFTLGIDDPQRLGLTTWLTEEAKSRGGYNFAYTLDDYSHYGKGGRFGTWKYGDECVLFRASGIKVYHYSDEEPQVIFWGSTARDIVPILNDPYTGDWKVEKAYGDVLYHGDLEAVVDWVVRNFDQYRRVLLWKK